MMFRPQSWRALLAVLAIFSGPLRAQAPPAPPGAPTQRAVTDLKTQARALAEKGDYAQAIKVYDAAVAAATKAYGAGDQRTDIVVNELANAHYNQGNYAEVESLYLGSSATPRRVHPAAPRRRPSGTRIMRSPRA